MIMGTWFDDGLKNRDDYQELEGHDIVPWVDVDPLLEGKQKSHELCKGCGKVYLRKTRFPELVCPSCVERGIQIAKETEEMQAKVYVFFVKKQRVWRVVSKLEGKQKSINCRTKEKAEYAANKLSKGEAFESVRLWVKGGNQLTPNICIVCNKVEGTHNIEDKKICGACLHELLCSDDGYREYLARQEPKPGEVLTIQATVQEVKDGRVYFGSVVKELSELAVK